MVTSGAKRSQSICFSAGQFAPCRLDSFLDQQNSLCMCKNDTKCPAPLQTTDITQPALEALAGSRVRRVLIVGRRGPIQIACTIKVGVEVKPQRSTCKDLKMVIKEKKDSVHSRGTRGISHQYFFVLLFIFTINFTTFKSSQPFIITQWFQVIVASDQQPSTRSTCPQELREMVKLPDTRPEMLAADFEGVAEALKGKNTLFCVTVSSSVSFFSIQPGCFYFSLSSQLPPVPGTHQ